MALAAACEATADELGAAVLVDAAEAGKEPAASRAPAAITGMMSFGTRFIWILSLQLSM
jgi:hypothetical protein